MTQEPLQILMVCLGNICRSPTAEAVFRHVVESEKLGDQILVDSAGTGSWHIGAAPDRRSMQAAKNREYDLSPLRARQVQSSDMERFDYIFAMDRQNLHDLLDMASADHQDKISLFLHHGNSDYDEVPDPYYSGADGFELVLDLIEDASQRLVRTIAAKHKLY